MFHGEFEFVEKTLSMPGNYRAFESREVEVWTDGPDGDIFSHARTVPHGDLVAIGPEVAREIAGFLLECAHAIDGPDQE